MLSLNTSDLPPKRKSYITLSLFVLNMAIIALGVFQIVPNATHQARLATVVKDEIVTTEDVDSVPASLQSEPSFESIAEDNKPVITTYVVKENDTLSSIAQSFSISTNTLLWANDLDKKSVIKIGQKLTILPVSGIAYTVLKGDTLSVVAEKFDADIDEIISFNDLEETKTIKVGMNLVIPNGEFPLAQEKEEKKIAIKTIATAKKIATEVKKVATPTVASAQSEQVVTGTDTGITPSSADAPIPEVTEPVSTSYFTHPMPGSILTQGIHGYNGVDLGAPIGTTVRAAASGTVIVAKPEGYNGGYGKYIVIEHDNGTQTLYGHLSKVSVSVDDTVTKGSTIGLSGNTGKSTGPHLHFEVRGGTNPWGGIKKLTKF